MSVTPHRKGVAKGILYLGPETVGLQGPGGARVFVANCSDAELDSVLQRVLGKSGAEAPPITAGAASPLARTVA